MSLQNIYILWAICAPLLLIAGWWVTKFISSEEIRVIIRCLIVAITFGFQGFGGHSGGLVVPAWALVTPRADYGGVFAILLWWVLVLAIYYVSKIIYNKLKAKKVTKPSTEQNVE